MATVLVSKELEADFHELVSLWVQDTQYLSNVQQIVAHPAYQRIIALDAPVLPLIFRDLPIRQSLRFWALQRISGEDPVPEGQSGAAAVAAWQAWGRTQGSSVSRTAPTVGSLCSNLLHKLPYPGRPSSRAPTPSCTPPPGETIPTSRIPWGQPRSNPLRDRGRATSSACSTQVRRSWAPTPEDSGRAQWRSGAALTS